MSAELTWGAPVTYADLQRMPDDGHRRELIDGQLLVTPSPIPLHQLCVARIYDRLAAAAPDDTVVLFAPLDWKISDLSVVEPDVLVTHPDDVDGAYLSDTPLLVVEVLSPSTRLTDLGSKRMLYERSGVGDYWIVDPAVPRLTALRLEEDTYREVDTVDGHHEHRATTPFTVRIRPSDLVATSP
ncbi:MAG: Uma2 family endonuclease [Actinobacteria bacterium]|nr:Uma2 family endonuclease [Actinomycetota bacterium]